jgi:hypothetical protein
MSRHQDQLGKTFVFRVTGATGGFLYGTDVYTTDSTIASACVHAGVLKAGETGIVRVTVLPGQANYESSSRNGVSSSSWSTWPASFKVQRAVLPILAPPKP